MTTLGLLAAYEAALSRGEPTYIWCGRRRLIPWKAFLDRGIRPQDMGAESFRRRMAGRIEARLARQPPVEFTLEQLEGERDARDRDLDRADALVAFGPCAPELHSKHATILVKSNGVREEIARFRRGLVMAADAQIALVQLAQAACRKFLRRLVGSLFHRSLSVGLAGTSNEERVPAGLQGPAGGHPQDRRRAA